MIDLTSEQRDFAAAIRDFCGRECGTREQRQRVIAQGGSPAHSERLYGQLAELGWLGVSIPEEYGGSGGSLVDACLFMEETHRGLAPVAGHPTSLLVASVIARAGTEDQKRSILGAIASGSVKALAISEPDAGSDVSAIRCRATAAAGGFVVDGQKTWCSHAHLADHVLVVARTASEANPRHGLSMLLVPTTTDGLELRPIETMGGSETNDLYFGDCWVDSSALVGDLHGGWRCLMDGLNAERLILAAPMLGLAQRVFEDTLDYVKQRQQFGRRIGDFQAVAHRLADMGTELHAARSMLYDLAARTAEAPHELRPREASMVKLFVTEMASRTALAGLQLTGAYGHSVESGMEQHVRTVLASTVYGGTSEIQREVIAKTLGLRV